MKRNFIVFGVLLGLSVSSLAFAAPPTEHFELGKGEVDIGTSVLPSMSTHYHWNGSNDSGDAKHKVFGGVTVGLGHNLALQYRYDKNEFTENAAINSYLGGNVDVKSQNQQYNLVYKVNDSINVYAGDLHSSTSIYTLLYVLSSPSVNVKNNISASKDIFQIGANYHHKIAKNTMGWVDIGLGNDLQHYEAGIGYALAKNLDFDLSYQYTKLENIQIDTNVGNINLTTQGLYAGLQYKF